MGLNVLLEQQRRYAKVIEDALGPSETIRRQVEQLAGPSFLDDTIRRMMTDVDAGLGHQRLMEQVERITALGAPISRQLKWLEQLQVGGGAVENAKRLLESLPPPINSQPLYSEPRLPMPTMPDLNHPVILGGSIL